MKISFCQPLQMKDLGTELLTSLLVLVTACLILGAPVWAEERAVFKPALQRQLEAQILPEVRFENVDLTDAIVYLQMKALASSKDALKVPFVVELPADFKPRYELTLDLRSVPVWEALRHLGGQAGVEFSIVKDSVRIRPAGAAAAAQAAVRTVIPAPAAPMPEKMAGRLGTPARPFGTGHNNHYSTAGVIQPERSGVVKRRSLSGWSYEKDRGNRFSMNCIDIDKCQAGCCEEAGCGCVVCGCRPSKVDVEPKPKP